jgi:pimeloyl-ACP methyl ester carboxylesterase
LHGGSAHAHWFDAVLPAFAGRFHVVSVDQRGHGQSAWAVPPAYGTEDFAADLLALTERLGWDRVAFVGHSMGGHTAMSFAAWHPERVRALVIVDARPATSPAGLARMRERGHRPLRRHPTVEAAVAAFRLRPEGTIAERTLLAHIARQGIVEHDGGWLYRFDPACNASRNPVDATPLLRRITAPTLIVRGEHSTILSRETAGRMRDAIPNASLAEISGAYHHLVLDAPDAFTRALGQFLAALA